MYFLSFAIQVCSKLCEKLGKHGLVKPKPAMRSLVTPLRMNEGMDSDVAPKKQPEVFEGPLLSSRDKAKIERKKRKDERQREVISSLFLHVLSHNDPHFLAFITLLLGVAGSVPNACCRNGVA